MSRKRREKNVNIVDEYYISNHFVSENIVHKMSYFQTVFFPSIKCGMQNAVIHEIIQYYKMLFFIFVCLMSSALHEFLAFLRQFQNSMALQIILIEALHTSNIQTVIKLLSKLVNVTTRQIL